MMYPYNCPDARIRHFRKCPCQQCQEMADGIEKKNELRLEEIRKSYDGTSTPATTSKA